MSKYPAESQYRNKLCRACRSGMYISRNEYSCCPGLDHTAVKSSHNDLTASEDVLEHYRYIITDALGGLPHLASLNLGSLATNNTLRVLSNSCPRLRELRLRAPAAVTDLGVRYLAGLNPSAAQQTAAGPGPGCLGLQVSASKSSILRFVITEKALTRAFSWLKAATTAFTFKTLC